MQQQEEVKDRPLGSESSLISSGFGSCDKRPNVPEMYGVRQHENSLLADVNLNYLGASPYLYACCRHGPCALG